MADAEVGLREVPQGLGREVEGEAGQVRVVQPGQLQNRSGPRFAQVARALVTRCV